ncbi:MAG: EAL domain-containing protein [Cyanobacteria bacterium J06627_8]
MTNRLKVLIIDDSGEQAFRTIQKLQQSHFSIDWQQIKTVDALNTALSSAHWDVAIAAYETSHLNAFSAIEQIKQRQHEIPLIVIGGAIGERAAVDLIKAGAHDFILDSHLDQLAASIQRGLEHAQDCDEYRNTEASLIKIAPWVSQALRSHQAKIDELSVDDHDLRSHEQLTLLASTLEPTVTDQRTAIEVNIDGICILQKETFIYANRAYLQMLGYASTEDIIGQHWSIVYTSLSADQSNNGAFPTLEYNHTWHGEAIARRKNDTTVRTQLSLTLTSDDLIVCVCRDISELKQIQEQLIHNSLHDPLTGLPNRSLCLERIEFTIARAHQRQTNGYAVLYIDLDRFKVINDSLGHSMGDQLLIAIARRLEASIGDIGLVARLGGDEFVVLLEHMASASAVIAVVEQILKDTQAPVSIGDHQVFTGISMGIVIGNETYHHAAELIRDADIAMCYAKHQSTRAYQVFDKTMQAQALKRLSLETDLRHALEQGNLTLRYQPIVRLTNQQLVGFEALVRWNHPTFGMISPEEFVAIAEEAGLIILLDQWVLRQACRQMAIWRAQFHSCDVLRVSINLSAWNFRNLNLLNDIDTILSSTGLEPSALTLEITESVLIEDIEQVSELLKQIASRQIQMCIDDFGTGYSSLKYLHHLPIHYLKIDSGFVRQMTTNPQIYQVVNTIIALGNQLGLNAVAEGIEQQQQLSQLKQLGCEAGQGYLFSTPLSVPEIETQYLSRYCDRQLT